MTILFIIGYLSITLSEFPHSEICGSMDMCSLPQLIAACHVLRRLLVPRHPPCALLHLTKSVAWWRSSGLHLLQSNCYLTLSESFLFFWFLGLTLKLYSDLSEPTKFWKNTLVIFLDFVFVVNLLIHKIYIQFSRYISFYPFGLVENKGFEPLTPCVQGRCSPSWANSP